MNVTAAAVDELEGARAYEHNQKHKHKWLESMGLFGEEYNEIRRTHLHGGVRKTRRVARGHFDFAVATCRRRLLLLPFTFSKL
jgi:hypothetical protein